jgi:formylglycine-generating enzyme required for sulfatase activity
LAYKAHHDQPETTGTADISEGDLLIALKNLAIKEEEQAKADAVQNGPDRIDITLLAEYIQDRAGLLLPRGNNIYTFPHRTFQEYLAACYLTINDYPNQISELVRKDVNRWREVALLAGAKAGRGSLFATWALVKELCCEDIKDINSSLSEQWAALIAGQLIIENIDLTRPIGRADQKTLQCVQQWLIKILELGKLPAIERAAAGRALALLGDPREAIMGLDKMEFGWIPAGSFWMGSEFYTREKPLHLNKQLNFDYWISRYPVTNAQFAVFVTDEGYDDPSYWNEARQAGIWQNSKVKGRWDDQPRGKPFDFGEPFNLANHPVVGITWYEALAFSRWLTRKWLKEGRILKDQEVRLPSEAEWEKAARGGEQIPENAVIGPPWKPEPKPGLKPNPQPQRNYPWGDEDSCEPNLANFDQTGIGATSAVGCFPAGAGPYGVLELNGNVWEWTCSVYKEYLYNPKDGREALDSKDSRVLRGGAWKGTVEYLRASYRIVVDPYDRNFNLGFRVVVAVARTP